MNHSCVRFFDLVGSFGVLGEYMIAIFARQQAPVIAAEQKVGAAERFQLMAVLKD